jgi:hypothetical protein
MTSVMPQNHYVFLSYSRTEEGFAKRLEQDLRARGIWVWRDESNIIPGSPDWEASIRDAISHAYAVVLIASPNVIQSLYIKGELNLAKRYLPKNIYPIWIDGNVWSDCVPIDFINTQYIDMRRGKYYAGLQTLINVLESAEASTDQNAVVGQQRGSRPVTPQPTTYTAHKFSRVFLFSVVIIAVLLISIIGAVIYKSAAQPPNPNNLTPTAPVPGNMPQLNQSYTGTASGFANASLKFSLISQDQQGNVRLGVKFIRTDNNKEADYTCQGKVTNDRNIALQCSQNDAPTFMLAIEGHIFPGGQMQGTMTATDSSDPNYHHDYTWNAN